MQPAGEDLHRDRLGVRRADHLEVGVAQPVGDVLQRGVKDVEVAHHAAVAEVCPSDHDLEPVVVGVQLALGALDTRHHVQGTHLDRRPDLVHRGYV